MKSGKYYLVREFQGVEKIIGPTTDRPTTRNNEGKLIYSSCGIAHDSLEGLKKHECVSEEPCRECGGIAAYHYYGAEKMIARNLCFFCNCQTNKVLEYKNNPNVVVIDGTYYTVGKNVGKSSDERRFAGHGGREIKIKRFNSEEILVCNNLWCGGEIQDHFKSRMPNNAKFV